MQASNPCERVCLVWRLDGLGGFTRYDANIRDILYGKSVAEL